MRRFFLIVLVAALAASSGCASIETALSVLSGDASSNELAQKKWADNR